MLKFGLELEAFFKSIPQLPPKGADVDGFPGLLEIRSEPNTDLYSCVGEVLGKMLKFEDKYGEGTFNHSISRWKFERSQLLELRRRSAIKEMVDIQNLYDKKPKHLNGVTIASLQLNISNEIRQAYIDDKGIHHAAIYNLVDIGKIVKALDKEFAKEIKDSGRQQGEYAIKDGIRLEYRSLPSSCFLEDFAKRVLKALEI